MLFKINFMTFWVLSRLVSNNIVLKKEHTHDKFSDAFFISLHLYCFTAQYLTDLYKSLVTIDNIKQFLLEEKKLI